MKYAWLVAFSRGPEGTRDERGDLMCFDGGIYEGGPVWKGLRPELRPERDCIEVVLGQARGETFADARDKLRASIPHVPMWSNVPKYKTFVEQLVPRSVSAGAKLL